MFPVDYNNAQVAVTRSETARNEENKQKTCQILNVVIRSCFLGPRSLGNLAETASSFTVVCRNTMIERFAKNLIWPSKKGVVMDRVIQKYWKRHEMYFKKGLIPTHLEENWGPQAIKQAFFCKFQNP